MDGLSFHPYPNQATDPLDRGYDWPNAGFANLDRIKQALWDAFRRHAAADDRERAAGSISTRSAGRSTPRRLAGYTGTENVRGHRRGDAGAASTASSCASAACDPHIAEVNFFGFYDDAPARHRLPGGAEPRRRDPARLGRRPFAGGDRGHGDRLRRRSPFSWYPAKRVIGARRADLVDRRPAARSASRRRPTRGAGVVACLLPGRLGGDRGGCGARAALTARRARAAPRGEALPGAGPFKARLRRAPSRCGRRRSRCGSSAEASPARTTTFSRLLPDRRVTARDVEIGLRLTANTCSCIHDEQMFATTPPRLGRRRRLWALFARDSGAGGPERSYRVQPGDTLWSIAASIVRRRSARGRLEAARAQPPGRDDDRARPAAPPAVDAAAELSRPAPASRRRR